MKKTGTLNGDAFDPNNPTYHYDHVAHIHLLERLIVNAQAINKKHPSSESREFLRSLEKTLAKVKIESAHCTQ